MKAVQSLIRCIIGVLAALSFSIAVNAQSSDQNFPTPVTTNEIVGVIKARDIGDSRLTTYFYAFDGIQGDIFINVVSKNLSGDIDIFAVEGLKPLTKMVVYADADANETGRLVYLRKPERLLLRVEGRTPGDDPATFRIKFAGSFVALKPVKGSDGDAPVIAAQKEGSGIRVNSVGTIIEPKPKKLPPVTPPKEKAEVAGTPEKPLEKPKTKEIEANASKEPVSTRANTAKTVKETPVEPKNKPKSRPAKPKTDAVVTKPPVTKTPPTTAKTAEKAPDPLANIRLVIQLKDGTVIEKRLNEIVKFSVDSGMLTVIGKNGNINRYSMLAVSKVTIE